MYKDELPLVSIITPSYNQGKFIRETIESVLTQDYKNIEYIVLDGKSTDDTVDILKEYAKSEPRFQFISEPDHGQGHAVNKGVKMASGEIIGWLNSDDTYFPGAIKKIVDFFERFPYLEVVYGKGYHIDEKSNIINSYPVKPYKKPEDFFDFNIICQPAAFFRKEAFINVNGINESLYFTLDYDLWIRIAKKYSLRFINDYLANSRLHPDAKTMASALDRGLPEILDISNKHFGTVSNNWLYHFLTHYNEIGPYWYLNLFKNFDVFKNSPKIITTNRYEDFWTGPSLQINIEIDQRNPLEALLIKGENIIFHNLELSVYLNNEFINKYTVKEKDFELEIPLSSSQSSIIEIKCSHQFTPSNLGINVDSRSLSYIARDIIPLSHKEHDFYNKFKNEPNTICQWLNNNRKETPTLILPEY